MKPYSLKPTGDSRYLLAGISVPSTVSYNWEENPHPSFQLVLGEGKELVQMTPDFLWGLPRRLTSVFPVLDC